MSTPQMPRCRVGAPGLSAKLCLSALLSPRSPVVVGGDGGIRLDAHFQTPAVFFLALTPGEADHPGALHPRWPRRKEASWLQPQASWGLRAEPDFLVLSQSCCVAGYLCPCGLLVTVSRPVGRTPNSLVTFQGFRL